MKIIVYFILIPFFILASLSCGDEGGEDEIFPEDKTYQHHLVTPEECEELHAAGQFFNCSQVLKLYNDGTANYMVTDIMMKGTYKIKGKILTLKLDWAYEVGSIIKFEIKNDNQLIGLEDGSIWELY